MSLKSTWLVMLALLFLLVGCQSEAEVQEPTVELELCYLEGGLKAECGQISVFENRDAQSGRQLEIQFAVVRATGSRPAPDPIFFLAGGPGQSAIESFPVFVNILDDLNETRDFIFVDQRGTGQSAPLQCTEITELPADRVLTMEDSSMLLETCRVRLSETADLSHYTTDIAMADLDDVRAALGYETINLLGISYGTRAAQTYMRLFPEQTRRVILDAVVSHSLVLNLQSPQTGQAALDDLFARCLEEIDCHAKFPTLEASFEQVLAGLETPQPVAFDTPSDLQPVAFDLTQEILMGNIFNILYSTELVALLPLLIDDMAQTNEYERFVEHAVAAFDRAEAPIYIGMQYAVVCSEDAPFIDAQKAEAFAAGSDFTSNALLLAEQCANWPKRDLPDDFREPLTTDIPVLMLSGESDPITPPLYAEELEPGFSQDLHLRLDNFGHGILAVDCVPELTNSFLEDDEPLGIDTACLDDIDPQPFFVNFAGPGP